MKIAYREYRAGDTIRVTGCQGRLFGACGARKLKNGVELGVECVLVEGEDAEHDVKLPRGILADDNIYLSVACIELVQAVEDKTAVVEHIDVGPDNRLFSVSDPESQQAIAQIWHDTDRLPEEVAKAFAESIKAAYDSIVIKRKLIDKKERTIKLAILSDSNRRREYREGDTIRVTGEQGRLFSAYNKIKLNNGVKLGVVCVLVRGEDDDHDVKLPRGILADGDVYISAKCIELVQAVEDK